MTFVWILEEMVIRGWFGTISSAPRELDIRSKEMVVVGLGQLASPLRELDILSRRVDRMVIIQGDGWASSSKRQLAPPLWEFESSGEE